MNRKETYILHHLIMIGRGKGKDLKLKEGRFRLDVRGKFFTQIVMSGTAAQISCGAPSLEVLRARLDGALGS